MSDFYSQVWFYNTIQSDLESEFLHYTSPSHTWTCDTSPLHTWTCDISCEKVNTPRLHTVSSGERHCVAWPMRERWETFLGYLYTCTLIHPHTLLHIIQRTLWNCYVDVYVYDICVLCHAWLTCVAWAMHRRRDCGAPQLALPTPTTHLWQFSLLSIILVCSEAPTTRPALSSVHW